MRTRTGTASRLESARIVVTAEAASCRGSAISEEMALGSAIKCIKTVDWILLGWQMRDARLRLATQQGSMDAHARTRRIASPNASKFWGLHKLAIRLRIPCIYSIREVFRHECFRFIINLYYYFIFTTNSITSQIQLSVEIYDKYEINNRIPFPCRQLRLNLKALIRLLLYIYYSMFVFS